MYSPLRKKILILLFLFVCIGLWFGTNELLQNTKSLPEISNQNCFIFEEDEIHPDLTEENVWREINRLEIIEPEIVMKQAIVETGWFKCTNCSLDANNIFGFRYKKNYLKFNHWTESVKYYKKWQTRHYKGGDYYLFLEKKGYSHSPTYTKYLKSIDINKN
jgi:hypothetical protein